MYPDTQYNDPQDRDWLPHAQLPTLRSQVERNHSHTGALSAENRDRLSLIDRVSSPLAKLRELKHLNVQSNQVISSAIALLEPEEKQNARAR